MRAKISLMAAPTALSPGGYVGRAYAHRTAPNTPAADLEVVRTPTGTWRMRIAWDCAVPVRALDGDVDRFVDAAAVLAPSTADAPFMTMGAPGQAVVGALWRPDRDELFGVRAEGLGTVLRQPAPEGWRARAEWKVSRWRLEFTLPRWPALDEQRRLGIAIWQGAEGDRGGLKSVSPGWIELGS